MDGNFKRIYLRNFQIKNKTLLDDPGSIKDIDSRYVNINRQINHWKEVLKTYDNHYIFKIRPDTRFKDLPFFKKVKGFN